MREFIGRRWRIRCPRAMEIIDRGPADPETFVRCSGLVVCDICNNEYYDHPRHPEAEDLTVLCNGKIVKL